MILARLVHSTPFPNVSNRTRVDGNEGAQQPLGTFPLAAKLPRRKEPQPPDSINHEASRWALTHLRLLGAHANAVLLRGCVTVYEAVLIQK